MAVERKQSLFIITYPGKETADEVYHTLRGLEKKDKIDIKTAVTLTRTEDGKLHLKHRQRLTLWKNEFSVGAIGLILTGILDCTVDGTLIGSRDSKQRSEVKEFLNDKLDSDGSALAIFLTNADWEVVESEVNYFSGEEMAVELSAEAEKRLAEIAADKEVTAAVLEEVEIEKVTL